MIKRWLVRLLCGFVGVIALAAGVGATYESVARRNAQAEFTPSGRLVDIGGRRLHIDCRGSGSPTVVFEDGGNTDGALGWAGVHDEVAATTRACAYSRAGILWSDPAPGPRDGEAVARDLHVLLENAGEHPPFVLVGHSIGGPYALIYTKDYGQDVAGLVFVDASHPDQRQRQSAIVGPLPSIAGAMLPGLRLMSRLGVMRVMRPARDATAAERAIAAYRPPSTEAGLREAMAGEETFTEAGAMRDLGDRPLIVMTADWSYTSRELKAVGMTEDQGRAIRALWKQMHAEMAGWSTNGEHRIIPGARHEMMRTNPGDVAAAVNAVVSRVRARLAKNE